MLEKLSGSYLLVLCRDLLYRHCFAYRRAVSLKRVLAV
jgi:hypothetical protein